jgi:hypothetical protein
MLDIRYCFLFGPTAISNIERSMQNVEVVAYLPGDPWTFIIGCWIFDIAFCAAELGE